MGADLDPPYCTLKGISAAGTWKYQDSMELTYDVNLGRVEMNPFVVEQEARTLGPSPFPPRGTALAGMGGSILYVDNVTHRMFDELREKWQLVARLAVPQSQQDQEEQRIENPLLRPAVYNIEYMESEYVIEKAKNVVALPHGDGKGGLRAANTSGPIVNAAGKPPTVAVTDVERNPVIVIQRNYASLGAIFSQNRNFKRSCNSDTVEGFTQRTLKYQLTESLGKVVEADYPPYYPGVTRIEVLDTTDLELDNTGLEYWDAAANDWKRARSKGALSADVINLKIDGDKGGDVTTTLLWRYLTEKAYNVLFE